MPKHTCGVSNSVPVSKSHHVEIIPHLITPDNQVTLDPQRLIWRWHPEYLSGRQRHLRDLQRPVPDELTDTRLDIAQVAQDDLSRPREWLGLGRDPADPWYGPLG